MLTCKAEIGTIQAAQQSKGEEQWQKMPSDLGYHSVCGGMILQKAVSLDDGQRADLELLMPLSLSTRLGKWHFMQFKRQLSALHSLQQTEKAFRIALSRASFSAEVAPAGQSGRSASIETSTAFCSADRLPECFFPCSRCSPLVVGASVASSSLKRREPDRLRPKLMALEQVVECLKSVLLRAVIESLD